MFIFLESCVQDHKGISNAAPADCPLIPLMVSVAEQQPCSENKCATEARIHDYISNLRFSISPTAFFQVRSSVIYLYILFV